MEIAEYCVKCGNPISPTDVYCAKCGGVQNAVTQTPPLDWIHLEHAYGMMFEVSKIPPQQAERFRRHEFGSTFPTALAVVLHFLTLGIFTMIFHGLKHSRLAAVRHDDFRAGKAIGFLFIPFFNLYWIFIFWQRLADRINFQYRLRGLPNPVNRGLVTTTCVLSVIPYIGTTFAFLIFIPIVSGQIQSACNQLATMEFLQTNRVS